MSAINIPKSDKFWTSRGKMGKECIIHTHDDLDGIFSAIVMKRYLINHGFTIRGYNIVDYSEGWSLVTIDKSYINVCVDYAEDHPDMDIYIDHHDGDTITAHGKKSVKTRTKSAYDGICHSLGLPVDKYCIDTINMIDSAGYDDYNVDVTLTLSGDVKQARNRLEFAAMFNQLIKRSDKATIIEVIHNCNHESVYELHRLFKLYHPANNYRWSDISRDAASLQMNNTAYLNMYKDNGGDISLYFGNFDDDGQKRIAKMNDLVRGKSRVNQQYNSQDEFLKSTSDGKSITIDGYFVAGNAMVIPDKSWCNPIRARAIMKTDINNGRYTGNTPTIILLQYGDSLQVCSNFNADGQVFATLKNGDKVNDLGEYCNKLLSNFQKYFGYETKGTDKETSAGGHPGIGNISNIHGRVDDTTAIVKGYNGTRFIDLFKNKMLQDLSGIKWDILTISWPTEEDKPKKYNKPRRTFVNVDNIRKL